MSKMTVNYCNKNVNPKNRKTGDCSTRALCTVLGISWEDALTLQYQYSLKTKYDMTSKQVIDRIMADRGYVKMKQPRKDDNTKYLVGEIDKLTYHTERKHGVLILMAHHLTAVIGDDLIDIWDCRRKTIGNYWIKPLSNIRKD